MDATNFTAFSINPSDDPRMAWNNRYADTNVSTLAEGGETFRVGFKINDLEAWKQLQDINFGSIIPFSDSKWLVTAQVNNSQFEKIRRLPFVESVEHGRMLSPTVSTSVVVSNEEEELISIPVDKSSSTIDSEK